jgi:hypothetical protein
MTSRMDIWRAAKLLVDQHGADAPIRAALAAAAELRQGRGDAAFLKAKLVTARFYADSVLARSPACLAPITRAGDSVIGLLEDQF